MRILFVLLSAILLAGVVSAIPQARIRRNSGTIWWVGSPPGQFLNITAAVNSVNVTDGDIIEVMNTTSYYENVTVDKSLTFRPWSSEPNWYPTLDGGFNVTVPGVSIEGFIIQNNKPFGIELTSSGNFIINNTIQRNKCGIYIEAVSANNTLRNNVMQNNGVDFAIADGTLDHFIQEIDSSNTVNGKPVCYLVNAHNVQVPFDPGYLAIVNSTDITANNFSQSLVEGVEAAYSSGTTISNLRDCNYVQFYQTNDSTIENNLSPVSLEGSFGNIVHNNTMIDGTIDLKGSNDNILANNILTGSLNVAVNLESSNNNSISGNTVNSGGIELMESNDNVIVGNNISQSPVYGLMLFRSNGSQIFHNNFLGHAVSVDPGASNSFNTSFDDGLTGNYWDDYKTKVPNSVEKDGTGIWNASYPINFPIIYDRFPLVERWTTQRVIDVTWYANVINQTYRIVISCPSLVRASTSMMVVRNESLGSFTFNITAAAQGYFNVSIPKDRLDYPFNLSVNGLPIPSSDYQFSYTKDASILYYEYPAGRYYVEIVGYKLGNICGDLNGDGIVNMRDIAICIANFNKRG